MRTKVTLLIEHEESNERGESVEQRVMWLVNDYLLKDVRGDEYEIGVSKVETRVEEFTQWMFTFGSSHYHPDKVDAGHLLGKYVLVEGSQAGTREVVRGVFGNDWAFQYPWTGEGERVRQKYRLIQIDLYTGEEVLDE